MIAFRFPIPGPGAAARLSRSFGLAGWGMLATLWLASLGRAMAADTPTPDQWDAVETAIANNDPACETKLLSITATYPRWPDGFITLAQFQLKREQYELAQENAQKALELAPTNARAANLAIQALAARDRRQDIYAIADRFPDNRDPDGWINYHAAAAAVGAKDRARAETYLRRAMARTTKGMPAEFSYLDARIAELAGDLERAEASLNRATASNPRFWDAWFELGRLQVLLAERKPERRAELLRLAEGQFIKVTTALSKDYESWMNLGRTQLNLGREIIRQGAEHDGRAKVREAIASLDQALRLKEDLRDAHLNLGLSQLVEEKYDEAIPHLKRARELGSTDRGLDFNLLLAYQKTGRTAEAEEVSKNIQAISPYEKIIFGMADFSGGNYEEAVALLAKAVPDLGQESERCAAVLRFIGHAQQQLAEIQAKQIDGAADKAAAQAENDRLLDAAAESYRQAGNLGDATAQRFFLHQETQRSSARGYAAGWQFLAWHSYFTGSGWAAVIGNYGGATTGGKGAVGLWERHPIHVAVWGVLALLPFCLFVIGLFRPRHTPPRRTEVRPATRPPPAKPPPAKAEADQKAGADQAHTLLPTRDSSENSALERRKPGETTKPPRRPTPRA
jgi:tetratricopeptide (TPR) repeat protein